ncbi:hypothetical protein Tco_1447059 [Tanacetum coccineum]
MDRRVCSYRKWELNRIPCKHDVAAKYNMYENSMGVGKAVGVKVVQVKLVALVNQPSATPSTTTGARNASSLAAGASQPSAAPSTASQGPTQHSTGLRKGFQAPRPTPSFRPQKLTKKIASSHNPRKLSS